MPKIARDELLTELREIAELQKPTGADPRPDTEEWHHRRADNLLLEFLDDEEITKAFQAIERWYA